MSHFLLFGSQLENELEFFVFWVSDTHTKLRTLIV